MYDDRQRTLLGTCSYAAVREVLSTTLQDNTRRHFGLPQSTLDKLNLQSGTTPESIEHVDKQEQSRYFNTNRTPEEDTELQHALMQSNKAIRQRELQTIDKSNGNAIQVSTHSL